VITVEIHNQQIALAVDEARLRTAVLAVMAEGQVTSGLINIAVVDDPAIREFNRRHLNHDYATDVISFVLEQDESHLEGELIVSADHARTMSGRYGWTAADELLLYVIHGSLHLIGHDDQTPSVLAEMRARERYHLGQFGLQPRYDD
jgi:probable rRNA maturation factor